MTRILNQFQDLARIDGGQPEVVAMLALHCIKVLTRSGKLGV